MPLPLRQRWLAARALSALCFIRRRRAALRLSRRVRSPCRCRTRSRGSACLSSTGREPAHRRRSQHRRHRSPWSYVELFQEYSLTTLYPTGGIVQQGLTFPHDKVIGARNIRTGATAGIIQIFSWRYQVSMVAFFVDSPLRYGAIVSIRPEPEEKGRIKTRGRGVLAHTYSFLHQAALARFLLQSLWFDKKGAER